MESYGLYEDLSLFNGDLLDGFPLLANEEPIVTGLSEDGLSSPSIKASTFEASPSTSNIAPAASKVSPKLVLGHPQQGSADLSLEDLLAASPTKDLTSPLESAWMDTKMDLLNLLTEQQQEEASSSFVQESSAQVVTQARPSQLSLSMQPGSPLGVAVVPSTSAPSTPEPGMSGSLDILQNLLDANVKIELQPPMQLSLPEQDFAQPQLIETMDTADVSENIFTDLDASGLEDLLAASLDASIVEEPILSPVSADDVESILSSSPPSPGNGLTSFIDTLDMSSHSQSDSAYSSINVSAASEESIAEEQSSVITLDSFLDSVSVQLEPSATNSRPAPYTKPKGRARNPDRKERKKEQNRSAALRYREKKRSEKGGLESECNQLQERNDELREKVDKISHEISYLKNLMAEVYKAKGTVPSVKIAKILNKK